MLFKILIAVALCWAAAEASALRQKRQAYVLPSGADEVVGDIRTTFSCEGRLYGYYADVDNNCQIFHVCLPLDFPDGRKETFTFSFFCGNQTVFDQETLVCTYPNQAIPCQDAPLFYLINENFGKDVWHTTPRPVAGYSGDEDKRRTQ